MLTVLTGPPCSGKSTYVTDRASAADVVIDLDAIAHRLGYPAEHVEWDDPHPTVVAARGERRRLVSLVTRAGYTGTAWLIDATPHPTSLRIYARVGARVLTLDPGRDECRARAVAAGRSPSTLAEIDRWYSRNSLR